MVQSLFYARKSAAAQEFRGLRGWYLRLPERLIQR